MRVWLALLFSFFFLSEALAWEITGGRWKLNDFPEGVPYCPVINSKDADTPEKEQAFSDAIDQAMYSWTANGGPDSTVWGIPCSRYLAKKSTCTGMPEHSSDQPWIYWESDWDSIEGVGSATIGLTSWVKEAGYFLQSHVLFNDRDYTWSVDGPLDGTTVDVRTIAIHELGHFIGLAHYDAYDEDKALECLLDASYPSLMCTSASENPRRNLTADDVQGACFLYSVIGELGAACDSEAECLSAICLSDGYCSRSCALDATCPGGYECVQEHCERLRPPVDCDPCGALSCDIDSLCVGLDEERICTYECSVHTDCPLEYYCAELSVAKSVCYPSGFSCDAEGPAVGEPCSFGTCALGDICFLDDDDVERCYPVCREDSDCSEPIPFCDLFPDDPTLGYCTTPPEVQDCYSFEFCECYTYEFCACDQQDYCEQGCACDPDCECPCDTTTTCENNCPCDPLCEDEEATENDGGCLSMLGSQGGMRPILFVFAMIFFRRRRPTL